MDVLGAEGVEKIRKCAEYKVLILLLLRKMEQDESMLPMLSALVTCLTRLNVDHKLMVVQQAVLDNMKAKNFRVSRNIVTAFSSLLGSDRSKDILAMDRPTDAQEWCVNFGAPESTLFCVETDRIVTSIEAFLRCNVCGCATVVFDHTACFICGNKIKK
jgi:hypothetical protein